MYDKETQQLILKFIEYAQESKPSEFRLIVSWKEYRYFIGKCRSYKLLLKGLKKSSKRLLRRYHNSVLDGTSNFNTLLAYQRLVSTIIFYEKELATTKDMIDEYVTYLYDGNWFWSFIGFRRHDKDMIDFRKRD